jgi:hypothetical protein
LRNHTLFAAARLAKDGDAGKYLDAKEKRVDV